MREGIFIRLLGAVTATQGSQPIDLGPARQRAALAILASAAARPVPMDQVVAGIWGERAPRHAEQSVYTYIAGLRRAFEPHRGRREPSRVLAGSSAGYVLCLEPGQVDTLWFAERVGEAHRAQHAGDDRLALHLLDQSLDMWRGTALSGLPGPFAEAERARLEDRRLAAIERRAEALLRLGRHQEATDELRDLTRRHPLRELVRELLMTALLRSGRRAEALEVYEEGRLLLAEELGLSPGEGLRRCHEMVLRADTSAQGPEAPAPESGTPARGPETPGPRTDISVEAEAHTLVPHQLPRPLTEFVGRVRETLRLKERLAPWDESPPGPLVIISGPPGVGKSALAAHVSHLAKDRFPDGQLYVNCRGATPELPALTALDVLGRFLRGLGVPAQSVPADLDEAAAMWRSRLHSRRVLALLDDAADLRQIRPLLAVPFGSALLVTSRESMSWGEDAYQLELARMSQAEATTMLAKLAGAGRMAAETEETARLVRLCEGLPLALRIAGARLASRPDWSVAGLTARLSDERRRLHELSAGDLAVRSSLSASHTALERGPRPVDRLAAHALALLGRLHVPEVTAEATGALLAVPLPEAEAALERLVDAHLIDRSGPARYQLHDLVRLFASELSPAGDREALIRALSYYAASARLASHVSDPHRMQLARPVDAAPHSMTTPEEARAWLYEEETVLSAAALQALNSSDDTIAGLGVNLAFGLKWHQARAYRVAETLQLNTLALQVSERLGDEASALLAHDHIANSLRMTGRTDEAVAHLQAELTLAGRLGDTFGEMRALGNLAGACNSGERYEEALPWAERQLALARRIDARVGMRFALLSMGSAHLGAGRPENALAPLREGLADAQEAGDTHHEAQLHIALGEACLGMDDPEHALPHFLKGHDLITVDGYRIGLLRCLIGMSRTYRMLSDPDRALACVSEAVAAGGGLGHARWERRLRDEQAAVQEARGSAPVHRV
ncbi:BTAD domain-containing putative transcriptional regulator [Nonomuraea sp. 10N515B]|uniref:BTAD domain-containing putative transcriptional regulator n=1 Tax=Nonomuraea sp. 10N515B TaxID=3457422 RepID=UPI003FCE24F8